MKITDFGLSRRAALPQDSAATQPWVSSGQGPISGTPAYMSPEQSRGEPITPKSDVFSLGAILYEMLTGRPAFTGENLLQVLDRVRKVVADRYAAEVPEPFPEILRGSFVRDPGGRAITMDRIADMLR